MTSRRNFLGGIAALAAVPATAGMPAMAGGWTSPVGASILDYEAIRFRGSRIVQKLAPLPVEGGMMNDHYRVRIPAHVLFAGGDDTRITKQGIAAITVIAETLINSGYWKAEIVGHKNARNSYRAYMTSSRQAEAVKASLESRGIQSARLQSTGLGNRFPVSPSYPDDRIELLLRSTRERRRD